jgi:lipopolysaccharide/colanic/teichoic acid biosynthesis glycosyltransferase
VKTNVAVREFDRSSKIIYIDDLRLKQKPVYDFFKRIFDIILSSAAIIVLSPVMLIVGILVFLQDFHNPFLFRRD